MTGSDAGSAVPNRKEGGGAFLGRAGSAVAAQPARPPAIAVEYRCCHALQVPNVPANPALRWPRRLRLSGCLPSRGLRREASGASQPSCLQQQQEDEEASGVASPAGFASPLAFASPLPSPKPLPEASPNPAALPGRHAAGPDRWPSSRGRRKDAFPRQRSAEGIMHSMLPAGRGLLSPQRLRQRAGCRRQGESYQRSLPQSRQRSSPCHEGNRANAQTAEIAKHVPCRYTSSHPAAPALAKKRVKGGSLGDLSAFWDRVTGNALFLGAFTKMFPFGSTAFKRIFNLPSRSGSIFACRLNLCLSASKKPASAIAQNQLS